MAVATLITDQSQVDELLSWGKLFSDIEESSLILIIPERSDTSKSLKNPELEPSEKDSTLVKIVVRKLAIFRKQYLFEDPNTEEPSNDGDELESGEKSATISINVLRDPKPGLALVDQIKKLDIDLLILPSVVVKKGLSEGDSWCQNLYKRAPCETLQIESEVRGKDAPIDVLIAVTGNQDDAVAIRRGLTIANATDGKATAMYLEPEIDVVAEQVGQKNLEKILKSSIGSDHSEIDQKVVLASSLGSGLQKIDLSKYDLVISGARWQREINQLLNIPISAKKDHPVGVAAIRAKTRYTSQFINRCERMVERFVPQLERDQRVELVQRIQSSSQWDFDFVALIFLSTLIAGLGLIRNSGAVVIGAMLVAPLMTPIIGAGLGLAHGNVRLIKTSLRTVLRGFIAAFAIGTVLGLLACKDLTPEMLARGTPNFLDLIVALASGIAAAYALGRPNLLSALPGVAIAAALVPPLAVSGIALAKLELKLAEGSLLLFLTNIVAIILGATVTFWTVGIRSVKMDKPTPTWPLWLLFLLVLISIALTATMSLPMFSEVKNS